MTESPVLAASAIPPLSGGKPFYKTSYFYLLIGSIVLGLMLLLFLPAIFNFLNIRGEAATAITQAFFNRWLEAVITLAAVCGLNRGGVTLIKTAAPYVIRFLLERQKASLQTAAVAPVPVTPVASVASPVTTSPTVTPVDNSPFSTFPFASEPLAFENTPDETQNADTTDDELEDLLAKAKELAVRRGASTISAAVLEAVR